MWSILYLLMVAVVMTAGQAPGDEEELCVTSLPNLGQNIVEDPPNGIILMDSSHYARLLPPNTGAVWQEVDLDGNTLTGLQTSWTEQRSACESVVTVCGWTAGDQNNWLFTQHINRTVNGRPLQQVSVMIEYEQSICPEETTGDNTRCRRSFHLLKYETSTIDPGAARNTSNYDTIQTLTTQVSGSSTVITENFGFDTEESGFYLALRDPGTCIIISRVVVFYYACPSETIDLVVRPETIAPTIGSSEQLSVSATCVSDSSPVGGDILLKCLERGIWIAPAGRCQCNPGFIPTMSQCLACDPGFYASVVSETCLTCPDNSSSTESGLAECPCNQGFYRTPQEIDLPCTLPPSSPLNVRVTNTTVTMVTLAWDEPVSTGGRSRDELRYNLWYRVGGDSQITLANTVTDTTGTVQGLSSNVEYEVFVTSETNITSQIPPTNVTLLARGDNILHSFSSPTVFYSELIVAVVVSVLVVVTIATVIIVIVTCVAVVCHKRSVSKLTSELTELRAIEHKEDNVVTEPNSAYGQVGESVVSPEYEVIY